ncbi:tetratricopeptide (TPR) repeat protein [Pullulanibacillus pueri]|uniref:TPR repeat-containing protein YrrB n=1 Tax=Pullulanibacillus pueri TaxID=1437324 RepID=A0A8J2ZY17_9BACL|nr:tetratricopeptide repeat protein [Pullulanibacillus pueri]MBM7683247.1 tetratricopeptide (TPR) repeat protein [Pullulanibacillus pueri]GGH85720.1 TPR repeat-containing protein YrrB [Pullulanibacillus pueri]
MIDWNKQGHTYLKEKAIEKAAEAFNRAIEDHPKDPIGYSNFGNLLLTIHEPARALAFFNKALELQSDYAPASYGLGNALYELERYEEAIPCFQLAEQNGVTDDGDIHYMLGMSYVNLSQLMMGLVHLQRAVELNEQDSEARFQYALCLAKLGSLQLALQQFDQVIEQQPEHADAHYNKGVALASRGQTAEAIMAFQTAIKHQKDHVLAANGLRALESAVEGNNEIKDEQL